MRFVVLGAGAIGGVVGAFLSDRDHEVVLVARGPHADAIERSGLTVETPAWARTFRLPVVRDPAAVGPGPPDAVLVAVKSQDTPGALARLRRAVPPTTAIVSLQNGVENERVALRLFERVYGVCVMAPTAHLVPGLVQAFSWPVPGLLDVGRYPAGVDGLAEELARAFADAGFDSHARTDIMRWKYGKLVMNLGNAVEALFPPDERTGEVTKLVRREGTVCLHAAAIPFVQPREDAQRRGDLLTPGAIRGRARDGGSTWQSVARRTGEVETDFLNGEIVRIGREVGIATPANALLQQLTQDAAVRGLAPGTASVEEFFAGVARLAARDAR